MTVHDNNQHNGTPASLAEEQLQAYNNRDIEAFLKLLRQSYLQTF